MHPQPLAAVRQRLHGQAVVHFRGAGIVNGHDGVVGQIHPDVSVRVWRWRFRYALSGSLHTTGLAEDTISP